MDTLTTWALSVALLLGSLISWDAPKGAEEGLLPPMLYISVTPEPLVAGQQGKVCYDFTAAGTNGPVVLTLTFVLLDGSTVVVQKTVTKNDPCSKFPVPSDATGVNIVDESNVSEDYGGAILPPPIG